LAYLVRRLLENGANSSFVNQIVDADVAPEMVAADPFEKVERVIEQPQNPLIRSPKDLFTPGRVNSTGWDLQDPATLAALENSVAEFDGKQWIAPRTPNGGPAELHPVHNPATGERVGTVHFASDDDVERACASVRSWTDVDAKSRAAVLLRAAGLYEQNSAEIFALLMREAGKTLLDCVGELREAVDFLRFYAHEALAVESEPAGAFACISPWNFPLAIFTGQVCAALAVGNGVLAKPAESTSLIADFAVSLLHAAGVPRDVLQCLPGTGAQVGGALSAHPRINGVCFTGSVETAQRINRMMARSGSADATLIAETGGLNAMIIDSTALPEQAVGDVLTSAFQSAGQRCSALRMLYVQREIADEFLQMLFGAMDELQLGDPRCFATDIGPVIDASAKHRIDAYVAQAQARGHVLKQCDWSAAAKSAAGHFVRPAVVSVNGIEQLHEEIFGPVLHVATYESSELDRVLDAINESGFGLTFGLHSRIDDRVQHVVDRVKVGNIYINRNQIGAVVGSQPFGGEGLSGTGPKAGGPRYLHRFLRSQPVRHETQQGRFVSAVVIDQAFADAAPATTTSIETTDLPGPTGESNRYSLFARGRVLCLGPSADEALLQASRARALGCNAVAVAPGVREGLDGVVDADDVAQVTDLDAVVCWSSQAGDIRRSLADRDGPIVPVLAAADFERWLCVERHVCIDTTAAGGNAELMDAD
jgi:RHH-type proline utilization regulon transcriptional repressor/proline dehydrogenase/delta 1-pyrroline-5-carboxylate dehydrogenase